MERTTARSLVLVGSVGAGKSSVGNALASTECPFQSRRSASGVTATCASTTCASPGLGGVVVGDNPSEQWYVIDTPGFGDGNTDGSSMEGNHSANSLLDEIEKCASSTNPKVNPTGGVDVFVLVFNASGRVTKGDLEAIDDLKLRFGAGRFLERTVVVFTHADLLRADGDDVVDNYLLKAPEGMKKLLNNVGGGPPVFADLSSKGNKGTSNNSRTSTPKNDFVMDLADAVRRSDAVIARSLLKSNSPDINEKRIVAADVLAAAIAQLPKLGMKVARRQRQEEKRRQQKVNEDQRSGEADHGGGWVTDTITWMSNLFAPPPEPKEKEADAVKPS